MFRKTNIMWLSAVILWLGTSLIFAQNTTGIISGTVTDPNGAVVQGASVTATNTDTNLSRTATTDADGVYAFQLLPPGNYKIEVIANGFTKSITGTIVVNIGQTTTVNIGVVVNNQDFGVVVEAAPVLQTETSQNGRTIEGATLRQLPLPTRNFQQLLTLQSGAQSSVSNNTDLGRGDSTISVNGQRTTSNSVRINGIDANSIGTNSTPNTRTKLKKSAVCVKQTKFRKRHILPNYKSLSVLI